MSDDGEQVDAGKILRHSEQTYTAAYNQRDLLLYAAGIGEDALQFTYEFADDFAAFPLYPVVLAFKGASQDVVEYPPPTMSDFPEGFPVVNPAQILHGEQALELLRPLDPHGATLRCTSRVISFLDKGSGALMETETTVACAETGEPIARLIAGSFIRGLSGFAGQGRSPPPRITMPDRAPDATDTRATLPTQTHLYRLSGDYNSLHIDPEVAQSVGFPRPILHGLCTMGFAASGLYRHFCQGDVGRFKAIRVRFTSPTFPGETLETQMWRAGPGRVLFRTRVQERDKIVIDGGEFLFRDDGDAGAKL